MPLAVGDQALRGRRRRRELLTAPFLSKIRPGGQAGDIKAAAGDLRLPGADLAAPLVDIAEGIIFLVTAFPSRHVGEPCA